MCGILGVYNLKGNNINKKATILMGDELNHRGLNFWKR